MPREYRLMSGYELLNLAYKFEEQRAEAEDDGRTKEAETLQRKIEDIQSVLEDRGII